MYEIMASENALTAINRRLNLTAAVFEANSVSESVDVGNVLASAGGQRLTFGIFHAGGLHKPKKICIKPKYTKSFSDCIGKEGYP